MQQVDDNSDRSFMTCCRG